MFEFIRRLFNAVLGFSVIVQNVYPRSANTVAAAATTLTALAAAWSYGAYGQIVAATTGDCWLSGLTLENFTGAASQGEIQIAIGAGGAEVVIATVQSTSGFYKFDKTRFIIGGTRIAARYRTSTGAADTVDVKVNVIEGI